jgi:hypothetical protein
MTAVAITGLAIGIVAGAVGTLAVQNLKRKLRRKLRKLFGPRTVGRIRNGRRVI